MSFEGNYRLQLDEKGRMRIPAKYREELGGGFMISPGPRGSLYVFTAEEAENYKKMVSDSDMFDPDEQIFYDLVSYNMFYPEVDDQGRFVLNDTLKKFAKIQKDIVVAGSIKRLKIWSADVYDSIFDPANMDFDATLKRLKERREAKSKSPDTADSDGRGFIRL